MRRDVRVYLDDIIEAIDRILTYSSSMTCDAPHRQMAIDAIIRNFEVIGEAARHITPGLRRKYPQIPWKSMAGMRDKLIHEYFGVNDSTLAKTIAEDLPLVKPLIASVLEDLEKNSEV